MKQFASLFFFVCLICLSAPAWADKEAEAQKHFDDGATFYMNGEYGKAIVEFMKGNDLVPNALFLYNIGVCHSRLGNTQEGIDNFVRARNMGGLDDKTATQNEARIVALRSVLKSQSFEAPEVEVAVEEPVEPTPQPVSSGGLGTLGWVGIGTTVVGAGLLVAAGVVELGLQSTWDDYEQAAREGDKERYDELLADIESRQSTGVILLAAGAGVTIVGVTLLVVDLVSEDSQPVVFISPDGSGYVGYRGAW